MTTNKNCCHYHFLFEKCTFCKKKKKEKEIYFLFKHNIFDSFFKNATWKSFGAFCIFTMATMIILEKMLVKSINSQFKTIYSYIDFINQYRF